MVTPTKPSSSVRLRRRADEVTSGGRGICQEVVALAGGRRSCCEETVAVCERPCISWANDRTDGTIKSSRSDKKDCRRLASQSKGTPRMRNVWPPFARSRCLERFSSLSLTRDVSKRACESGPQLTLFSVLGDRTDARFVVDFLSSMINAPRTAF